MNHKKTAAPVKSAAVVVRQYESLRWHCPNQVTGLGKQPTLSLLLQAPFFCVQEYHSAAAFARGWPFSIGPLRGKMEKTKGEIP